MHKAIQNALYDTFKFEKSIYKYVMGYFKRVCGNVL